MGLDFTLVRVEGGSFVDFDPASVYPVLRPFVTDESEGWVAITTSDGRMDVYGWGSTDSLMANRIHGDATWDLLVEVARAGRLAIISGRGGTYVTDQERRAALPDGLPEPVLVVASGADLYRALSAG